MSRMILVIALLCLPFSTSAGEDRKRISLAPPAGIYSDEDIQQELLFGREMAAILLADRKLSDDPNLNRYVNLVGQAITRHANRPELTFYFAVVESPQINAYAIPGGYIFVTSAALARMQNEAELAGVLAHEIAHVTDRHIVKALDIRADDDSATAIVGKIVAQNAATANVVFYQTIDKAFELLYSTGLAAEDEYDADLQGIVLTTLAGYDPSAYVRFLERIAPEISTGGELNSTHPPFQARVGRLKEHIDKHGLEGQGGTTNATRFRRVIFAAN